jgi:hypothetical protein
MLSESCNRVDAESSLNSNNQTSTKIVTRMLRICDSKWSSSTQQQQQQQQASGYANPNFNQRLNRESVNYNTQENLDQIQNMYTSGSATNSATLTETVLDCDDSVTLQKHHLLQSAYFHELVGDQAENSSLFMTFNSSASATSSVVCRLTIKDIDAHFVSMLRKCLDGDNTYAELVSPYSNKYTWKTPCRCSVINDFSRKLPQSDIFSDRKLFCHNDFFNYMNSRKTLSIKSIGIAELNRPITSIASLNARINENESNQNIVLILATLDSQILMFNYNTSANVAYKYDQISLINGKSISAKQHIPASASLSINLAVVESDVFNETSKRVLYATYDRYLYKINLQNCEQYRTCEICLNGASNR